MSKRLFLAAGLLVALLLAGVVSSFASSSPDGLDATARSGCTFTANDEITGGTCMLQQERHHQLKDSPLADYGIKGISNAYVSTGLAGVAGVLITFGVGAGVFWLARRRSRQDAPGRRRSRQDALARRRSRQDARGRRRNRQDA
jgi:cobalt/nickel transport protein